MPTPSLQLDRGRNWRWWVCCLLLLATTINYMDRLTLNLLAPHIIEELGITVREYGRIESGFALAFAAGAICFGFLVDRWNLFWIYPLAVLGWSAAGFATGQSATFAQLLLCRVLLGFAESANWPCALRTTQRILPPGERSMGNSILQSGAALGAILVPLVVMGFFDEGVPATWRKRFFIVGAVGAGWVVLWWLSVRPADLALQHLAPNNAFAKPPGPVLSPALFTRRYAVLIVLVVTINMTWHFLRAWGPLFLQKSAGFTTEETSWFSFAYYVFSDVGTLSAGFLTLQLVRGGMPVHAGRRLVFFGFALLTALCAAVPFLPGTWTVVAALLVIGVGALGGLPELLLLQPGSDRPPSGRGDRDARLLLLGRDGGLARGHRLDRLGNGIVHHPLPHLRRRPATRLLRPVLVLGRNGDARPRWHRRAAPPDGRVIAGRHTHHPGRGPIPLTLAHDRG